MKQLFHLSLKVFFRQLCMYTVKFEDTILILGPDYIICAPNVSIFLMANEQQTESIFEMPGKIVMYWTGFISTDPGDVIRFGHFETLPLGAAPATSKIFYITPANGMGKTSARRDEKLSAFGIWRTLYLMVDGTLPFATLPVYLWYQTASVIDDDCTLFSGLQCFLG